jgi:exonuclease VII small subunit
MMNFTQFLKAVDQAAAAMSKEQLAEFIHETARTLPENQREDFLAEMLLFAAGKETHICPEPSKADQEAAADFEQKRSFLRTRLERMESGELCLEGSLNPEYDDWYSSAEEEFLYSDPEGILDIIEEACRFVHQCVDCEEYQAACELTGILIGLDIMVGGEYQEYTDEPININDLKSYHLGNVDYRTLVIDAARAAYCASALSERADELYITLMNSGRRDITLEMILQGGRELPEIDAFLPLWIEHLGRMTGSSAGKLLQEALELADDGEQLLANARKYCGEHPELYEQYLTANQGKTDADSLLAVGTEALEAIEKKYLVRSRVALLTSRTALEQDRPELAETCWLEAFRSDTRVVNYLRLLMECRDFSNVREAAAQIYRETCSQLRKDSYFLPTAGGGRENQLNPTQAYLLAFLGGEFDYVRERAMNATNSLGWSASFMKCGLAAFLLLLTEDGSLPQDAAQQGGELKTMKPGAREMLRRIVAAVGFDKSEYEKGTLRLIEESNEGWFLTCWNRWKRTVPLSREQREALLGWAEGLVTKRVQGIMEGNHRNYYGECAAYIAALGEAREAGGEPNGKQATMAKYMEAYNRRSAFRQVMRGYGMQDTRKKK